MQKVLFALEHWAFHHFRRVQKAIQFVLEPIRILFDFGGVLGGLSDHIESDWVYSKVVFMVPTIIKYSIPPERSHICFEMLDVVFDYVRSIDEPIGSFNGSLVQPGLRVDPLSLIAIKHDVHISDVLLTLRLSVISDLIDILLPSVHTVSDGLCFLISSVLSYS